MRVVRGEEGEGAAGLQGEGEGLVQGAVGGEGEGGAVEGVGDRGGGLGQGAGEEVKAGEGEEEARVQIAEGGVVGGLQRRDGGDFRGERGDRQGRTGGGVGLGEEEWEKEENVPAVGHGAMVAI